MWLCVCMCGGKHNQITGTDPGLFEGGGYFSGGSHVGVYAAHNTVLAN